MVGEGLDRHARAFDKVIKALEQEPCEDAVSKEVYYQEYGESEEE